MAGKTMTKARSSGRASSARLPGGRSASRWTSLCRRRWWKNWWGRGWSRTNVGKSTRVSRWRRA